MYKRFTAKMLGAAALIVTTLFAQDELEEDPVVTENSVAEASIVYAAVDSLALMESRIRESCSGKADEALCLDWMKSQNFTTLQILDSLFCKNRESIHACKFYLDSVPREKLGPYLRSLEKNFLLDFFQTTTVDTVYDKEMTKGECARDLDEIMKRSRRLISEAEVGDSIAFDFGECTFDGSKNAVQTCTKKLAAFAKERKRLCATEVVMKRTREKFEKRTSVRLFDRNMNALWAGLWNLDWFERDSNWTEDMKFLQRMGYGYSGENLVTQIRDAFQKTDDVWNFLLLNACEIYPQIDDAYEKKVSFRLFDCAKVREMHKTSCDGSVQTKEVPRTMNGLQASRFVCDAELYRWRLESDDEKVFGLCTEKNLGEEKKTAHGIVICDKNWKMLSKADTWDRDFSKSGVVNGKFRPKREYFRDNRDGKIYRIVRTSDQAWMAAHLNYATLWGSKCADGVKEQSCTTLGRLYNLEAAKHACPEGWHLPNSEEWKKLYAYLQSKANAKQANKLLTVGTFVWQAPKGETSLYYWLPQEKDSEEFSAAESTQNGVKINVRSNKREYYPVRCVQDR